MDGKRFGVGLAAGLIVGLAIVAASGGVGVAPSLFAALSPASKGVMSSTTTVAATSTMSTSTAPPPDYGVNGGSGGVTSVTSTATSTSASTNGTQNSIQGSLVSLSSGLSNISTQSPTSNAIIVVPVLVAFLLGAVLYRASNRGRVGPDEGES